jgi:hypothetical protein
MKLIFVTALVSHDPMSWLNEGARQNMDPVLVTVGGNVDGIDGLVEIFPNALLKFVKPRSPNECTATGCAYKSGAPDSGGE